MSKTPVARQLKIRIFLGYTPRCSEIWSQNFSATRRPRWSPDRIRTQCEADFFFCCPFS